jgi:two-component system nitrogen regulation response regulator NtrX
MQKSIVVVDDEKSIRESLYGILTDEGFNVFNAKDGNEALKIIKEENPDIVLLDIWMPGMSGIDVLKEIKENYSNIQVIMMSGHGTIETAVKATKIGAYDFIEKPLSLDKLILTINNALNMSKLEEENRLLKEKIESKYDLIGESRVILKLKEQIRLVAPTSGWVLISGENGTGKELVARMIHRYSKRANKSFVPVNCAAIPEELIESELFGHEKGAFTGALTRKIGKFDMANEGTLFLDEIGDMSLKTQAKILRILQEQSFERVGGSKAIKIDVRVIAATNKDLEYEIRKGNFREDLYYRLNVIPFVVPPLRERKEDIPLLISHFIKEFHKEGGLEEKILSDDAMNLLMKYNWPGNVRELKNIVERLMIMTRSKVIDKEELPEYIRSDEKSHFRYRSLKDAKEHFEREFIIKKLKENNGNIARTAEVIGIARQNLHAKIKMYGIKI